jgi:hypothetical protein
LTFRHLGPASIEPPVSARAMVNVSILVILSIVATLIVAGPHPKLKKTSLIPQVHPRDSCSGLYDIGIGDIDVVHQRSLHEDTIYIAATVAIGNTTYNMTKSYGKHGQGNFNANITFSNLYLTGSDVAVLSYAIINSSGDNITSIEENLLEATARSALKAVAIAASAVEEENIEALILDTIEDTIQGTVEEAVIGISLSDFVTWLGIIGLAIAEIIAGNCDGFLAAGLHAFNTSGLCQGGVDQGVDSSKGVGDEKVLGFIPGILCSTTPSLYNVTWVAGEADNATIAAIQYTETDYTPSASDAPKQFDGWNSLLAVGSLLLVTTFIL